MKEGVTKIICLSIILVFGLFTLASAYEQSFYDDYQDILIRTFTQCVEGENISCEAFFDIRNASGEPVTNSEVVVKEILQSGEQVINPENDGTYKIFENLVKPDFSVALSQNTGIIYFFGTVSGEGGQENVSLKEFTINIPVNGQCGSANGGTFETAPTINLCTKGKESSVTKNEANWKWNWTCFGINEGTDAVCSANVRVNGQCGSANGGTFETAPTNNLCNQGNASAVTGTGPWYWTCQGINDGDNANCSANKSAPVPPGNPDLVANLISGIPGSFEAGQPATIKFTFSNQGNASTSVSNGCDGGKFTVKIYANGSGSYGSGTLIGTWSIDNLATGQSMTVSKTFTMGTECSIHAYCFYIAKVDADNCVTESNENNNVNKVITFRAR